MNHAEALVSLVTPAFLGGAGQSSEWRSPPFKALIRQWWRVVVAKELGYDHDKLREAEGNLLGNAWLKEGASRSQLALRLSSWAPGQLPEWLGDLKVDHPEVGAGGMAVGAHLYLGYGPLGFAGGTKLNKPPALGPQSRIALTLGWSRECSFDSQVDDVFTLLHWCGTVGGRSRNGWGSFQLHHRNGDPWCELSAAEPLRRVSRDLEACLKSEWPTAVGSDGGRILVWRTSEVRDKWSAVMQDLARVKIAFRTALDVTRTPVAERHLLAYPVTHHTVDREGWGNQGRLANQLRFKVHRVADGGHDRYLGLAFHLPCGLPKKMRDGLSAGDQAWVNAHQLEVWRKVHAVLDHKMCRIG